MKALFQVRVSAAARFVTYRSLDHPGRFGREFASLIRPAIRKNPSGVATPNRSQNMRCLVSTCPQEASPTYDVWVAETTKTVVGYVAVDLPVDELHGEIYMIAVAPDHQGRGVGTALTKHAVEHIRTAGRQLAVVETGGDPGHAAARATYDKSGFVSLPAERYYLAL